MTPEEHSLVLQAMLNVTKNKGEDLRAIRKPDMTPKRKEWLNSLKEKSLVLLYRSTVNNTEVFSSVVEVYLTNENCIVLCEPGATSTLPKDRFVVNTDGYNINSSGDAWIDSV